jgi:hypothetical protein
VDNIDRIAELVNAFMNSLELAVKGDVEGIAKNIVTALRNFIVVAIDFLAKLLRLGDLGKKVRVIIKALRTPVIRAMNWLLDRIKSVVRRVFGGRKGAGTGKGKKREKQLSSKQVVSRVMREMKRATRADTPAAALAEKQAQAQNLLAKYQSQLKKGQLQITIVDRTAKDVEEDAAVDFDVSASPGQKGQAPLKAAKFKYVERKGSGFQLKPKYQGAFKIRTRMYLSGLGYGATAKSVRDEKIRLLRCNAKGELNPKGKYWKPEGQVVPLKSPTDPTVEHKPTVVSHWNNIGRKADQATRRAFFTFAGKENSLKVLPRNKNSELGGGGEYNPVVTASFTGPGGKR